MMKTPRTGTDRLTDRVRRLHSALIGMLAVTAMVVIASAVVWAAPAMAQDGSAPALRPPRVTSDGEPPVFWMYFSTLVIVLAAVGANMIPSKRGHQD